MLSSLPLYHPTLARAEAHALHRHALRVPSDIPDIATRDARFRGTSTIRITPIDGQFELSAARFQAVQWAHPSKTAPPKLNSIIGAAALGKPIPCEGSSVKGQHMY